jgi:hypothetical protein
VSPPPALAQPKAGISSGSAPMNLHPWHRTSHLQITRFGPGDSARRADEQKRGEIASPIHHSARARRYTHKTDTAETHHGRSRCAPRETAVVHRCRSHRDEDGDLRVENHPAATILGVSMGFVGCPSNGGDMREWKEEGASRGGVRFPRAARKGDAWVGVQVSSMIYSCHEDSGPRP